MNFKEKGSHGAGLASLSLPFNGGAQEFHVLGSAATVANDHYISRSYSSCWNDRFPRFSGLTLKHFFLTYITIRHRSAKSQVLRISRASPRWPEPCRVFSLAEQEASKVHCLHTPCVHAPLRVISWQGPWLVHWVRAPISAPHTPRSYPFPCPVS